MFAQTSVSYLTRQTASDVKVLNANNVKLAFILKKIFAKLVAETVLNVVVLVFAQNANQVYHNLIPTINASASDSNLTPLQIFVSRVVIFTTLAVTAVIKPSA